MRNVGISRRHLLASAGGLALTLLARRAAAATPENLPLPYGPLAPVADETTGLPLLQLPAGFRYASFGWAGEPMSNGAPTPAAHDGMAVFAGAAGDLVILRNHEMAIDPRFGRVGDAVYDGSDDLFQLRTDGTQLIGPAAGAVTRMVLRNGKLVETSPVLAGTWRNCAGAATPWGTWLSCEETAIDFTSLGGQKHGYVFEVSPETGVTNAEPIRAMGRFNHESAVCDPVSGAIYLTEDDAHQSGLYRYVPAERATAYGDLAKGGKLSMARVKGVDFADLRAPNVGDSHELDWVEIADPDLDPQAFDEEPFSGGNLASGCFGQGRAQGAARFARLEGAAYDATRGLIYLTDTAAGRDAAGEIGLGEGAIWVLDPVEQRLTCAYVSARAELGNNFDNLTVSPQGLVVLCEDGGGVDDEFGPGERLLGLGRDGTPFVLAKNNVMLDEDAILRAGKSPKFISPGDYRQREWSGPCFDPSGQTLFVSIYHPGISFAITGPWKLPG